VIQFVSRMMSMHKSNSHIPSCSQTYGTGFPFISRNNSISDESHQLFGIKPRLGQRTTVDNFSASLNKSLHWSLFIQFDLMEDVTVYEATLTTFATWRPSHTRFLDVLSNGIFIESQPLVPHDAHDKAKIPHRSFRLFRNHTEYMKCPQIPNILMFHQGGGETVRIRGIELMSSVIREIVIIWRNVFQCQNRTATKYTNAEHIPIFPKCSSQRICIVFVLVCARTRARSF